MSEPTPPLPDSAGLETAPQPYGPYLLLEKVGAGGMAEVFRAVRNGPQGFVRQFAIKRIIPRHAESSDFVEMFCNEARLSALLSHQNLVQVYDFGEVDGSYYLAMEFLKGRTVLSVMRSLHARKLPFPIPAVAHIARQAALGLSYAHTLRGSEGASLNLVHRDVNPSNIMLLKSGMVKVLDFGIAKSPSLTALQTQAGLVKGKLSYAPPEQLKCRPLDGRADVFSLGVTLWEMATMRKLFGGRTDFETVTNVMTKTVQPPSSQRPDIPEDFDAIVLSALQRDPEKRPDAKALAARLGDFLIDCRFREDSMAELMRELFGSNTSRVLAVPAMDGVAMSVSDITIPGAAPPTDVDAVVPPGALRADGSAPAHRGGSAALPGGSSRRGIKLALTLSGAVGLAVLVWASWSSLRQVSGLFTNPAPVGQATGGQSAAAMVADTLIDLDSRPSGAQVEGPDGTVLGHTPLTVRMRRSRTPTVLVFKKAGFAPLRYQVTPERDSIATLELDKLK
jgi:eukaryotic-like serine/threonine-protein kinase